MPAPSFSSGEFFDSPISDAPDIRISGGRVHDYVVEIYFYQALEMISRRHTGEVEHVYLCRPVRSHFLRALHDLGIAIEYDPTATRDLAEPLRVGYTQRLSARAEHFWWRMTSVPQREEQFPDRPRNGVLVKVELRRRGPGGRERRLGRLRLRSRVLRQRRQDLHQP